MQKRNIKIKNQIKTGWLCALLTTGYFIMAMAWTSTAWAKVDMASSTWFVDMKQYAGAAHGTLKCEECHGTMTGKGKMHPDPDASDFLKNQTKRSFDYQACQKCHKNAYERFLKGEHAKAALSEKTDGKPSKTGFAPSCGDCHSAHYSKSHLSRVQIGELMTQTCGTCHLEQKNSYLANYHGKAAVNLDYDKAAFCTDCHGAHTTVSLKDKDVALKTCQRCHFDATPEFANIIIHDSTKNPDQKNDVKQTGLKWVHGLGALSLIFVIAFLVFFYIHTGLLMLRKLQEKLRRHK